MWVTYLTAR